MKLKLIEKLKAVISDESIEAIKDNNKDELSFACLCSIAISLDRIANDLEESRKYAEINPYGLTPEVNDLDTWTDGETA